MRRRRTIIPIFIPHQGCPHRCVFCNQHRTARMVKGLPSAAELQEEVRIWLDGRRRRGSSEVQVAFYGGSFTALPLEVQEGLLGALKPFLEDGEVDSLRLSTRPDAVDEEVVELLRSSGVRTVELGVQSMDPEVLRLSSRGYGPEVVPEALKLLKEGGFEVGVQLMLGLPGDTPERFLRTVEETVKLKPHFVRLYPTLVIKGTALEAWFHRGFYRPLDLEEAVELAAEAVKALEGVGIEVVRMGLQPTEELQRALVAGPYHPAFGQLVRSRLLYERARSLLEGKGLRKALFEVAPEDLSDFYGQHRENWRRLKEEFELEELSVLPEHGLGRGELRLVEAV